MGECWYRVQTRTGSQDKPNAQLPPLNARAMPAYQSALRSAMAVGGAAGSSTARATSAAQGLKGSHAASKRTASSPGSSVRGLSMGERRHALLDTLSAREGSSTDNGELALAGHQFQAALYDSDSSRFCLSRLSHEPIEILSYMACCMTCMVGVHTAMQAEPILKKGLTVFVCSVPCLLPDDRKLRSRLTTSPPDSQAGEWAAAASVGGHATPHVIDSLRSSTSDRIRIPSLEDDFTDAHNHEGKRLTLCMSSASSAGTACSDLA